MREIKKETPKNGTCVLTFCVRAGWHIEFLHPQYITVHTAIAIKLFFIFFLYACHPAQGEHFYSQKMDDGVGSIYYVIKAAGCLRASGGRIMARAEI